LSTAGRWNEAWKRRFFVLVDKELFYFEDDKQAKRKGSIDLAAASELRVGATSYVDGEGVTDALPGVGLAWGSAALYMD
jgi:hypothetical protein